MSWHKLSWAGDREAERVTFPIKGQETQPRPGHHHEHSPTLSCLQESTSLQKAVKQPAPGPQDTSADAHQHKSLPLTERLCPKHILSHQHPPTGAARTQKTLRRHSHLWCTLHSRNTRHEVSWFRSRECLAHRQRFTPYGSGRSRHNSSMTKPQKPSLLSPPVSHYQSIRANRSHPLGSFLYSKMWHQSSGRKQKATQGCRAAGTQTRGSSRCHFLEKRQSFQ
jgi:hypothetical protein